MIPVEEAPEPKTANGQGPKAETAPPATMTAKAPATLLAFVGEFAEEVDRLFEDFGLEAGWFMPLLLSRGRRLLGHKAEPALAGWTPRIEVLEREGQFVVRADLPGTTPEDVKVEVVRDYITPEGERKREKEEREGYYSGECRYGACDRLTMDEAADLGARLPLLIRGLDYEGWDPSSTPVKERRKEVFLHHIAADFRQDPEPIAWAVFKVMEKHVSPGEIKDVPHTLPREIRSLWPGGEILEAVPAGSRT